MQLNTGNKRPNILWICTDQQRWDTLGCYGNSWVQTPNLDALAANSAQFDFAFCQSPICTPSRSSFLSGRYPRTTRCRQNGQSIPADEILVTKMLADSGYHGGLAGKLHISACEPSICPMAGEPRIDDGYAEFNWSHDHRPIWPANAYGNWLKQRGKTYHTPAFSQSRYVQTGMPEPDHQTTWCVEKASEFIRRRSFRTQPWFFSLNLFDPHHPFDPPAEYLQRYLDRLDEIPLPNFEEEQLQERPLWQQLDHQNAYNAKGSYPYPQMTDMDHRLVRAAYWAMIDLIDVQLGRLFQTLRDTGQWDNTLIIFMSDHGEMLGDHGIYLKGPYCYEEAVRVPLLMHMPGKITAGRRDQLVELTDLAPTILDIAGMQPHPGMQGKSLVPVLTDYDHTHREDVYCEYHNTLVSHRNPTAHVTMLRNTTHKLVVAHGQNTGELYDLTNDPKEQVNLWCDTQVQVVKMQMLERLCDRMAWTVDPLPQRLANW
jgi:choline-sulfatase